MVHHREGDAGTWRDGETTVAVRRMSGDAKVRNDGAACKLTSPPLPRWSEALRQLWTS